MQPTTPDPTPTPQTQPQPTPTQQPPAWHQLNYNPPPMQSLQPPMLADTRAILGAEFRRLGRGLRDTGRNIWATQSHGLSRDTRRLRAFLRQPPRWFLIATTLGVVLAIAFCALSLSGAVSSQAGWLRSLMP